MSVCGYFLQGRCRYGEKCWNLHPRGGRNQTNYSGGGSVNRVWVNPSQRLGGASAQSPSFSHRGDWDRGNSRSGRDDQSSNFSFNSQNRFSTLSTPQNGYERTGGGGDDTDKQLAMIQKDMEVWQSSGQWIFSCYAALKASITGFVELSPEELRLEYYTRRAAGDLQSYDNSVQQLASQWRSRVQELRTMSANTHAAMIAELSNPRIQTSAGGAIFSSSSSAFGSSSSPPSGFHVQGFALRAQSGAAGFSFSDSKPKFGSSGAQPASSGFWSSGAQPASSGFGSSGAQPASSGFGSSAASTFSFGDPRGATVGKDSATGFSFSSGSAGGFSGSSAGPCGEASVTWSAEDRKSGGENVYTPQSELTPDELREFANKRFTLGQIPLRPPPVDLLSV